MALQTVCFDLETIADPQVVSILPPVKIDSRLKDPAKIKDAAEEAQLKQRELMGTIPSQCLICCASFYSLSDDSVKSFVLREETPEATKGLLREIWAHLHQFDRFVSFNGIEFDVPVLQFQSMANGVPMAVKISAVRYRTENHLDLRALLSGWDKMKAGTFDFYCKRLLGSGKPQDIDGSAVQHFWDCGESDMIRRYCEDDVTKLAGMYRAMKGYYF